jgi:hypothetical protein
MDLIELYRSHSRSIAAKSSALEVMKHAGNRGTEREQILKDFLLPLLPERFTVGSGEILANNGNWSRQEDLIIYDRHNCPRIYAGGNSQIFPIESVAAVIEVKTSLRAKDIAQASQNIAAARRLKKAGMSTHVSPGAIQFGEPSPTLGVLFAYDLGMSLDSFRRKWDESQSVVPSEERINLTCILDKMVIVHLDRTFHLWDTITEDHLNSFTPLNTQKDSLLTFVLLLMRVLGETRFGIPDLFKYVFSDKSLEFTYVYKE